MHRKLSYKKMALSVLAVLLIITSLLASKAATLSQAVAAGPVEASTVYIPMVITNPQPKTSFGSTAFIHTLDGLPFLRRLGGSWTRVNLFWNKVEVSEGVYDWTAVSNLENGLKLAYQDRITVILTIVGTPTWALKPGYSCGAVAQDKFPALQKFVAAAAERYSVAPYGVKYWEIWNEPDTPRDSNDVAGVYGCWGDPDDPYYGGEYYGQMLQAVYPAIKKVDQVAQVVVGGLQMDCDPRIQGGTSCNKGRFLEGILRSGAGSSFDGVSFHAYDYYGNPTIPYANLTWNSAANSTGPVLINKTSYIRSLLNDPQYNAQGKFLINTEVALLCDACDTFNADFEKAKADYVTQAYAVGIAEGLAGNLWFTIPGWRNSGLIDENTNPLPGYQAYISTFNELSEAAFLRKNTTTSGVKIYEFVKGDSLLWVAWAQDAQSHEVTLPSVPVAVKDNQGNALPVTGASLSVSPTPLFIEFAP